jgi:hypothetical protein
VVDHAEGDMVVTPIAIEAYHEAFSSLAKEHPECWHLCQKAEDRCRAEHFPRLARKIETASGRTATWSQVFTAAAEDDRYWDREVRRPALTFLARGKRQNTESADSRPDPRGAKKPRIDDRQRGREDTDKGKNGGGGAKGPKNTTSDRNASRSEHPRKNSKGHFITTREGKEVCFKFATGTRGACKDPCEAGRVHVCMICLQPHANKVCTKKV